MEPKPATWFFTSRKGLLTTLAILMTLALAVGIIVGAILGEIPWPQAIALIVGSVFSSALVMMKAIDGLTTEDVAKGASRDNAARIAASKDVAEIAAHSGQAFAASRCPKCPHCQAIAPFVEQVG